MSDDKRSEIDEKRSEVETETEDQANQPGRLAGTLLMFRDLWRLIRGEDQRGRKVRWLLGLLRPYRRQVIADDRRRCWWRPPRRWRPRTWPGRRSTAGSRTATRAR